MRDYGDETSEESMNTAMDYLYWTVMVDPAIIEAIDEIGEARGLI